MCLICFLCGCQISGFDISLFECCILFEWVTLKSISLSLIRTSVSLLSFPLGFNSVSIFSPSREELEGAWKDNCWGVSSNLSSSLCLLLSLIEAIFSTSAYGISLVLGLCGCYLFVFIVEIFGVWFTLSVARLMPINMFLCCVLIFLRLVIGCTEYLTSFSCRLTISALPCSKMNLVFLDLLLEWNIWSVLYILV